MAKRQSSSRPASALVARSRSTTAINPAISWRLGWCGRIHTFFCHSAKLMLISEEEDLWRVHHRRKEMMASLELSCKFAGAVNGGVDLPSQHSLGFAQCAGDCRHRAVADHHQVYIAGGMLPADSK